MPLEVYWRGRWAHMRGTVAGTRIRKGCGTRDPAHAERIRAETEARAEREALYGQAAEATFADAYLRYHAAGKPRRYLGPIVKALGRRRLADIMPGDLKALALKLYPHAKGNTRNRSVIGPARAVINHAAELGLCVHMRVRGFKSPKVIRTAVDREWIDAVRAHAINPYIAAFVLFCFTTAARAGEALLLAPEHVDLTRRKAISAKPTKNGQHRIFYLTEEMCEVLAALPPKAINYGHGPVRVFGYATTYGFCSALRRSCKAAGVEYHCPHEAGRHSFATEMLVRQGVDPVTTARLGNWEDINVMLRHYAHAGDLQAAADASFGNFKPRIKRVK